jgi:hypothetical protein
MQDDHSDEPDIISKRGQVYGLSSGALRIVSVVKVWTFVSIRGEFRPALKGMILMGIRWIG